MAEQFTGPKSFYFVDDDGKRRCACDNCDWTGAEDAVVDLAAVSQLAERVEPGAVVPAGECPACGCLAYLVVRSPNHG